MPKIPRRYEKIDAHTVKLIVEKEQNLDLASLITAKEQLEGQIKDLTGRLENINEIIKEAGRLGITAKVKDKDVEKKHDKGSSLNCSECKKRYKNDQKKKD